MVSSNSQRLCVFGKKHFSVQVPEYIYQVSVELTISWNNVYMDTLTVKMETEKFQEAIKITQKTTDEVKSLALCILLSWYITQFF